MHSSLCPDRPASRWAGAYCCVAPRTSCTASSELIISCGPPPRVSRNQGRCGLGASLRRRDG
eukprot:4462949-Pyramimonas_sp.AAC.1